MKLLYDQNLSPRLVKLLDDLFPDSLHVRAVNLHTSDDSIVWGYALENHFTIVSKDVDFQQRSLLYGAPPKFIWLRLGNCSVSDSADLLRRHSVTIHTFELDAATSHLILP